MAREFQFRFNLGTEKRPRRVVDLIHPVAKLLHLIACDLKITGVLVDVRGIGGQRAAHDQPICCEDFGSLDHN